MANLSSLVVTGGSTAGASRKNYAGPGANSPGSFWVSSGSGVTVEVEMVTVNLPESATKKNAIKITRVSGSDFVRGRFMVDPADAGKTLIVQWSQKFAGTTGDFSMSALSYTDGAYSAGATSLTITQTAIPATGTTAISFISSITLPAATVGSYIEVRINALNGTTPLYISGVEIGPGELPQGPVLTAPAFFPATGSGFTYSASSLQWERIGGKLRVQGTFTPATSVATAARIVFPDSTWTAAMPGGVSGVVGRWYRNSAATGTQRKAGTLWVTEGANFVSFGNDDTASAGSPALSEIVGNQIANAGEPVTIEYWVPITQFQGSGGNLLATVTALEYASNTNTTNAVSDTTSFSSSASGSPFVNAPVGTTYTRRVKFSAPITSDDILVLELDGGSLGQRWLSFQDRLQQYINIQGIGYGVGLQIIDETNVDVIWGSGGWGGITPGANSTAWSGLASWRWRVRKAKAQNPVGYPLAPMYNGPTVGPELSYTPTFINHGTATFSITEAVHFQVGEYLEFRMRLVVTPTAGSGTGFFGISLPPGLTTTFKTYETNAGVYYVYGAGVNNYQEGGFIGGWAGVASGIPSQYLGLMRDGTSSVFTGADLTSGLYLYLNGKVRIDQWIGKSTVQLATVSQVEYVSNSSATDASDTSSFVNGPSGARGVFGTTVLTAPRTKRVRFSSPVLEDDLIIVELQFVPGGPWYAAEQAIYRFGIGGFTYQGSTGYGIGVDALSTGVATDVDIVFGQYAWASSATYTGAGNAWNSPTYANFRWRVRKAKATTPVGFTQTYTGPTITDWQAYTPVFGGGTSTSTNQGRWRQVGDMMEIETYAVFTAAGNTSNFTIALPPGYTINNPVAKPLNAGVSTYGTATIYNTTQFRDLIMYAPSPSTIAFSYEETSAPLLGNNFANAYQLGMKIAVQINEFSGRGTVLLSNVANVEYAYNSSASLTGDTTSFALGQAGTTIKAYAPTGVASVGYRVQFSTPIEANDLIQIEVSRDGGTTWLSHNQAEYTYTRNDAGTTAYGMSWHTVSTTQIDVFFFSGSTPGVAWSAYSNGSFKWRVRKAKAQAPVGFVGGTGSGSSGFTVSTKSANFTAATLNHYLVDTSAGSVTVTTPTSPADGAQVKFSDASGTFSTNALVISTADRIADQAVGESFVVDQSGASFQLTYSASLLRWVLDAPTIAATPQQSFGGSDWVAYVPTVTNLSVSAVSGRWRRVGDSIEFSVQASVSGAATGNIQVSLPPGLTVDLTKINNTTQVQAVGTAYANNSSRNWTGITSYLVGLNPTAVFVESNDTTSPWAVAVPFTWAAGHYFSLEATLPIVGYSSNVTLIPSSVLEWGALEGATSIFDSNGAAMPTITAGTSATARTFSFPSGTLPTDMFTLEILAAGTTQWFAASQRYPWIRSSANDYYGCIHEFNANGSVGIYFGNRGAEASAGFGANGTPWNTVVSRYRLRKTSAGFPAGFSLATSATAGFVKSYEEYDHVTTVGGPFASQAVTIRFVKVGKQVTMTIPRFNAAGNNVAANITFAGVIPGRFLPDWGQVNPMYFPVFVVNNNADVNQPAALAFSPAGGMSITVTLSGTQFGPTTGGIALYGFTTSYRSVT